MDRLEFAPFFDDDHQDHELTTTQEISELLKRARVAIDRAHLQVQRTRLLLEECRVNRKSGYERF